MRRSPRPSRSPEQTLVESLSDTERRFLSQLFAADLAVGWIPRLADLRAGLALVRVETPAVQEHAPLSAA